MKNLLNLGFITLFLIVLGCSCPRLKNLTRSDDTTTPTSSPTSSNSTDSPTRTSDSKITMAKFEQLKTSMKKSEVESILGGKGTEISTQKGGDKIFSVYRWDGENYSAIIITFEDDKVITKSQAGLK